MKGRWAQGMTPRGFAWVIRDQLAVCERPGGYGASHRRVRRSEEIVWLKTQGVTTVVTTSAAPHNVAAYDDADLAWRHVPFGATGDASAVLADLYPQLQALIASGERVVLHHEKAGDRLQGIVTGYLVFAGLVEQPPRAIAMVERLLERPLGALGRELVAVAARLRAADDHR